MYCIFMYMYLHVHDCTQILYPIRLIWRIKIECMTSRTFLPGLDFRIAAQYLRIKCIEWMCNVCMNAEKRLRTSKFKPVSSSGFSYKAVFETLSHELMKLMLASRASGRGQSSQERHVCFRRCAARLRRSDANSSSAHKFRLFQTTKPTSLDYDVTDT